MDKFELVPKSALDISKEEEQEQKLELVETIENTSLSELRKQAIVKRSQSVLLDSKESNLESARRLNDRIAAIVDGITDADVVEKVFSNIETGKDYNEAVKAVNGLIDLRNKQLDRTIDEFATGKKKRIAVQFQTQGVKVSTMVETDE